MPIIYALAAVGVIALVLLALVVVDDVRHAKRRMQP